MNTQDPEFSHEVQLVKPYAKMDYWIWVCTKCNKGPFKPSIVCRGKGNDFEVVSGVLDKKEARAKKAELNIKVNRAEYWCMEYKEYLLLHDFCTGRVCYDQTTTLQAFPACKGKHKA